MRSARQLLLLAAIGLFSSTFAQTLNNPESVEYDAANDRYLISNTGSNEILAQDQAGNLSVFASTSSSPYGLEIVGSTVYACQSPGMVKGYDLSSGAEVFSVNTGAGFANGITTDGTDLFISDFSGDQILKVEVATQTVSTVIANTNGTPNGIIYIDGQNLLLVAFWGTNAPLKAYNVLSGLELITVPTTLTNIDGITVDCNSQIYFSSWSPDQISVITLPSTTYNSLPWSVDNPADMDFDAFNAKICIPNSGNNTVSLETVVTCPTSVPELEELPELLVYPNPANEDMTVLTGKANAISFTLTDLTGRVVLNGMVRNQETIELSNLTSGQYVLQLEDGRAKLFAKN